MEGMDRITRIMKLVHPQKGVVRHHHMFLPIHIIRLCFLSSTLSFFCSYFIFFFFLIFCEFFRRWHPATRRCTMISPPSPFYIIAPRTKWKAFNSFFFLLLLKGIQRQQKRSARAFFFSGSDMELFPWGFPFFFALVVFLSHFLEQRFRRVRREMRE
ncbi:hypothetical protein BGZ63DRAFT_11383 [Mariannaea sp. PMI_226]|nr:hypothetical protein BGZ63DRAFT_11383 [Mariannaea sp. PMI_226]